MSGHVPVLLAEVLEAVAPVDGAVLVDATFGGGGYSRALLASAACEVIGLDRDPEACARGRALENEAAGRFRMVAARFSGLDAVARQSGHGIDAVIMDVGVSSYQIDEPGRGFSFMQDGPLDMRMERDGPSAADLVATLAESELARLFFMWGEEREARRLARAIVADRVRTPFTRTRELAALAERVAGRRKPGDIHPATRMFQALRIAVNDELAELDMALRAAEAILKPGGRLVVVSFHSLEDRIVKTFIADSAGERTGSRHMPGAEAGPAVFEPLTRKPVVAGSAEIARNPRARSAKLRAARRTHAPARSPSGPSAHGLDALLARGRAA